MSDTNQGGRPSKFDSVDMRLVSYMARHGATDVEMAKEIGVHEQTIHNWKKAHPEFFEKLKCWKEEADEKVERKLYERAMGYDCKEEKAFCYEGIITTTIIEKHFPPDVTAMIFWLKNRKPKEWRDRQEINIDNKDQPISVTVNYKKKGEE